MLIKNRSLIISAKERDNIASEIPDHPMVAKLLRDGEPDTADCCCRCSGPAGLWSDEFGAYCFDCAMELWDTMDERRRAALMGFEEI